MRNTKGMTAVEIMATPKIDCLTFENAGEMNCATAPPTGLAIDIEFHAIRIWPTGSSVDERTNCDEHRGGRAAAKIKPYLGVHGTNDLEQRLRDGHKHLREIMRMRRKY